MTTTHEQEVRHQPSVVLPTQRVPDNAPRSTPAQPRIRPTTPDRRPHDPYAPVSSTNILAIASMVVGILAAALLLLHEPGAVWGHGVGSIVALVLGFVARDQIRRDRQPGAELALTGVGLGFVGIGVLVAYLISLAE